MSFENFHHSVNFFNTPCILVTLGPSSLSKDVVEQITAENIYLLRINLSHTPVDKVEKTIHKIQQWTEVPICLDSEGAQIRNQSMAHEKVEFNKSAFVKIHYNDVIGDTENISFTPRFVAKEFVVGDRIRVDFNSVCFRVVEKHKDHCLAVVEQGGIVASNKAADIDRDLPLVPITDKDKEAIEIGKKMGIKHFALSFANSRENVDEMRKLAGESSIIISKIESKSGLINLNSILASSDQIIVDRGDLSRQIAVEKIPFLQRRIISQARAMNKPVFIATNLLETMVTTKNPTRAEANDVASTLLMGANGLVLASETAIGGYPVEAVEMIGKLIEQYSRWTPNTSIVELLANGDNPEQRLN